MGQEIYAKFIGVISFVLTLGLLVTACILLAGTRDRDENLCNRFRLNKGLRPKRYDHDHDHPTYLPPPSKINFGAYPTPVPERASANSQFGRSTTIASSEHGAGVPGPAVPKSSSSSPSSHQSGHEGKKETRVTRRGMFTGLAIATIVVASVQILASFLGCCSNKKTARRLSILWMFINMILVIGLIIIFSLSMYYNYNSGYKRCKGKNQLYTEWLAFTVLVALNAFLSLVLITVSYYTLKSRRFEYESAQVSYEPNRGEKQKLTKSNEYVRQH